MNPIEIPATPPPELQGMSGATLRSAFMATVLAHLPVNYRNYLPAPGDVPAGAQYQMLWQASLGIINRYNADMDEISGPDRPATPLPRRPESVKPIDLIRLGIDQSHASQTSGLRKAPSIGDEFARQFGPKPTGAGVPIVPIASR